MNDLYRLAKDIAESGVKRVFGVPGSGPSLALIDYLERFNVEFCLTHFEGTAAIIAGTIGKLSGITGVSIGIKGPGLANMVPGLASCFFESMPVVAITEAYSPDTPHFNAHKRLDHQKLTSAVVKESRFLSDKGLDFKLLAEQAQAEMPGPVHLDISSPSVKNDSPANSQDPLPPQTFNETKFFEILSSSKKPVIIAGTLAVRKGWSERLNKLSVPVFSVAAAKGVVDETLKHSAGVYTGAGLELSTEYSILPKSDLVICLGLRYGEVLNVKPFHCASVNVDPLGDTPSSGFGYDCTIEGSWDEIDQICSCIAEKEWGLDLIKESNMKMYNHMLSHEFMPANVFMTIEQHFKHRARLILDTGSFCTVGEHIWRVPRDDWYISSGQGRYMGTGIPMAIGAALYDNEVPTVAFIGDGGIGMFISDIKIAVQRCSPLLIILMSDGYFGSIRSRSIADGLTQKPLTISKPSWLKVFEGFGVESVQAESIEKLDNIVSNWKPSEGPLFIQIPFDPEKYLKMAEHIRAG
jgi:acetolactate synthase-1/2/3 large subunit